MMVNGVEAAEEEAGGRRQEACGGGARGRREQEGAGGRREEHDELKDQVVLVYLHTHDVLDVFLQGVHVILRNVREGQEVCEKRRRR